MRILVAVFGGTLALLSGCTPNVPFAPRERDVGPPPVCTGVTTASVVCVADVAYRCDGMRADAVETTDCTRSGETCAPGIGCLACVPGRIRCAGETREQCTPEGTTWQAMETCDAAAGLRCSRDGCLDLCALAAETESYIGCEYSPVTLANSGVPSGFAFAIAIANPQLVPAIVTIEGASLAATQTLTVAPSALEVVELPWVDALRGDALGATSVLVRGGAYRVRSDVPVTVTQFNPLAYRRSTGCTGRDCFSFTNDASLLLPTHVLTGSYLGLARASQHLMYGDNLLRSPGFLTLVGVSDTPVHVEVRSTAPTIAGPDVAALVPGTPTTFELGRGDVLQLLSDAPVTCPGPTHSEPGPDGNTLTYCDLGPAFDLTGTEIRSDGPLAAFAGHDCTFVPYDRWACDHLEEQLFPVEALGNDLFLPVTAPLRPGEPNVVRIVSAADGNTVHFEPPLVEGEPAQTLDRGEYVELEMRAARWVRGTGPLLGAIFLVGQDYAGLGSAGGYAVGDPSMALAVPNAQFRDDYAFLSPASYETNAADVVAPIGARIELDGTFVRLVPVEGTTMGLAHLALTPGTHTATGSVPFGLYVSGFGSYTSYYVPGGMDFVPITAPF